MTYFAPSYTDYLALADSLKRQKQERAGHLQSLTNLAILFTAASKGDQLDPAGQFALIRARVLTY